MRGTLAVGLCCATLVLLSACGDDGGGGGGGDGDGGGGDAGEADAPTTDAADGDALSDALNVDATPVMSITAIFPSAASRVVATNVRVTGANLASGASMTLTNCDTTTVYDLSSTVQVAVDGLSLGAVLAADPAREQGLYTVTVTNPDQQTDSLVCAFRIVAVPPPTVTDVIPASAYRGVAGDGVNSDETVSIVGTGFVSTPTVRWVKTDGTASFDALFTGFVSSTQLTAVVPSETLGMPAGQYHVFVTNPDLLSAQWLVNTQPGIFTVTSVPPPSIENVTPARIENGSCTSTALTITGGGFAQGATVWYQAPAGVTCTGSIVDANGVTLCPLVVDSVAVAGNSITAHFGSCPAQGPYPLVVINPDQQSDVFYSVEITPSSDGHLNTGSFTTMAEPLQTARWKHAAAFGFDAFGHSHVYVAGGQNAAGTVLGSVETSQFNIFGTPGRFRTLQQYGTSANPRVANPLTVPRQGLTMVRLGRNLFALGGTTAATDTTTVVAASNEVENARILSYDEMPGIRNPTVTGPGGLPLGSWYYRVSALGPWGESLATREVVVLNQGGTIAVCWNPPQVSGATSYIVYRSLAPDGRAATSAALAYEVTGPCFTDTGTDRLTAGPRAVRGTLATGGTLVAGTHTYRVSATVPVTGGGMFETYASYPSATVVTGADVTAGNRTITVAWDPVANATYAVFKLEPTSGQFRLLTGASALTTTSFSDGGLAFDASNRTPRVEVVPLPSGSLSRWSATAVPNLGTAREGLDGVAIEMDPMTSGGLVGRILVAGGRTSNTAGAGAYLRTSESLGVFADGTFDASWFNETPLFTFARAQYALLTTQGRTNTPFPPPPDEPPCGDNDGDGFIPCDCAAPGTPPDQLDCNDNDAGVHPGATEICGDGIDQDCDMGCTGIDMPCVCSTDVDQDQHVSEVLCGGDDCCDNGSEVSSLGCTTTTAPGIHPGAVDICSDGIDQDCDGIDPTCTCTTDADADGHVAIVCGGDDCCDSGADPSLGCTDTTDQGIHPGAIEICGNGIDDDCEGTDNICRIGDGTALASYAATPSQLAPPRPPLGWMADVIGSEPVYLVAVAGDSDLTTTNNQGRQDYEVCRVDAITGHLACTTWTVQTNNDVQSSYAGDATLYFSYLYPFYGVARESINVSPSTRQLINSAIGRHPLLSLTTVTNGQIVGNRQSASTSFTERRAYYQMLRLLSYVYVIGGWSDTLSAPTGTIERHQQ